MNTSTKQTENLAECGNKSKPLLNDGFIIDFFELMFLAESVIPDRPIARSMCFDDFSERHYHKMNDKYPGNPGLQNQIRLSDKQK